MNRALAQICFAVGMAGALGCQPEPASVPPHAPTSPSAQATPASHKSSLPAEPYETDRYDGPVWFTDMTAQTGIDFQHVSGNSAAKPFPSANGSGVAVVDFDLDGWADLYFASGAPFPLDPQRREPFNRCFRNRGDWKFEDVSAAARLDVIGYCAGLAVGDYDSDGFPDIYIACYGPNVLLRNQGDGTFERVEVAACVADPKWGTSAAFWDYDEDGLLDLYVCNYAKWTWETHPFCGDQVRKVRMHCGPRSVQAEPHLLYHNDGDGTFHDVAEELGLTAHEGRGQGVVAADLNADGHIDLYVGNDLHPNFLFFNEGGGKLRDATEVSGAAYDSAGNTQASMGVDAADFDRDGRFDLFVTNFQQEYNTLYQNLGQDFFIDASNRAGVVSDSLPWVGWGTQMIDFNLDGWLDLVVTNGHVDDNRHLFAENAPYAQPPLLYRNDQGRFTRLGPEAGPYFRKHHVGRGLAASDLDNDGDDDLVVVHQDNRPALLRNERRSKLAADGGGDAPSSIRLRLIGTRSNRDAIGAALEFQSPLGTVHQQVKGGASYLSSPDRRLIFAVPAGAAPDELSCQIRWPSGATTRVTSLRPGLRLTVIESVDEARTEVVPFVESSP